MTSRLNGAGVFSGNGVPTADMFGSSTANGTPLYLDLDTGLLYWLDDNNDVQTINPGVEQTQLAIGAIYLSVDITNPNTALGYGTWVRFSEGRMLIGLDENNTLFDAPEETGGFADSIVVEHTHLQDPHTHTLNNGTSVTRNVAGALFSGAGTTATTATISNQNSTAVNQSTGVSGTNRNYPPFITVYMWKRTA